MAVNIPLNVTNINNFINAHAPGTEFKFLPGTYRFSEGIAARNGDKFIGTLKEGRRLSIISGAKVISKWKFNGQVWHSDDHTEQGAMPSPADQVCLPDSMACAFPEDLFMDDDLKERVVSLAEVRPGSWFFDYPNNRVYVGDNPHGRLVEMSVLPHLYRFPTSGECDVLLQDVIVEKYAAPSGSSGVGLGNSAVGAYRWECNACEVRYCHGGGIGVDAFAKVRNNYVHHNGGFGLTGAGWDILIEGNEIAYNNTCGYNPYWGAGGSKWVWTTDLVVRGNYSHHNRGVGLWTDINNLRTTYENNIVEYNTLSGIFHEISYDAIIRNNKCRRNGLERAWPWWTANAGISVVSSRNVEVYDNYCENNWQEITGLDDGRGNGIHGPWILENFRVHNNRTVTNDMPDGSGRTGVVGARPYSFDHNQYHVIYKPLPFFNSTHNFDWAGWQGIGQDLHSTFQS